MTKKQLAGVAAKLNRFVQGAPVTVATPDNGGKKGDVKALKTSQGKVFQMRFFEVAPPVRLLGVFPQFDVFLGCRIYLREELEGRWSEKVSGMFRQLEAMGRDMPECLDYSNLDAVLSNWKVSI
ncbi:hypothetical protein [Ruegeria arenilitoris]|uniref:hypothetical protein n=1 Tax=Ruegeria arenilitoris TaxID=1173585 RepID=UPI00147A0781|nr:hypothetical protein [Ruegeria arenilitoris]